MKKRMAVLAGAFAAVAAGGVARANEDLQKQFANPNQWAMPLGNYAGQRYSELTQINQSNVKDLRPVWQFSTGVLRGHEGGPLVIGDVMYIHTPFPNKVFALDLKNNGRVIWRYEPTQDPTVIGVMCCDTVNRGLAYADGRIFLPQADTTLVALDAKDGKELWKVKNGDPAIAETMTMAPIVVRDKVYVGISGGEYGVRGRLTAYNTADGKLVWKGYSTGPDAEMLVDPVKTTMMGKPIGAESSTKSWQGEQWKTGGGSIWGWTTYDPATNLIYYGTGNPSTWNPRQRPGDNRWSMTIFARDADTGMAKWVYQKTPHDEWDFDGVNENVLTDLQIGGRTRKVLVNFDRNGFAYVLDRENGELISAEKYQPSVNWASGIDKETGRPVVQRQFSTAQQGEDVNTKGICPAALGNKNQQPVAHNPKTGMFFVPINALCMDYEPFRVSYTAGQPYVGATLSMFPTPGSDDLGRFIAYDAASQKIVWSKNEPFSVWSGALATAGDVVFYGTLEGYLKAVDAKTGNELYRFRTPSGIIGNVNTFSHGGKQYIAVYSGVGGWAGIGMAAGLTGDTDGLGAVGAYKQLSNYTQLGGVLTVFGLPN